MKQLSRAVPVIAALLASWSAQAANTVSGSYVGISYNYDDIRVGSGFKIAFDHRFEQSPIRLEVAYIDADADVEATPFAIGYEGLDLSLSWVVPASRHSDSSVWLGAGFYNGDATIDAGSFGSADDSAGGLSLGIGADWMPTPVFGFRFEYKIMVGMEDFAEDENLDLFSAGLVVAFGKGNTRDDDRRGPVERDAASAYEPLPPPPPPPPPLAVGQTVNIGNAGATLHQRDGSPARLPAGTAVELVSTRTDRGYTWWWVRTGGREGWVLQSELEGQGL